VDRRPQVTLCPALTLSAPVFLHTGTGTAQTTAISTAAITAVIFSLVTRSMTSSERDPTSAPALYAAWVFTL
jgi:hypothetical protein